MGFTVEIDRDLEEIVPTFLENRHKELIKIAEAIEAADFASLQIIGHKLAGNSGGYGFAKLGELGAQIEQAAIKRSIDPMQGLYDQIKHYLDQVEIKYI
ncbi:MAG: Hpt domain-containing protein [Bdellovibrionales bacterium]|jgi:HPt (histidine-containing phosphotransfer) domain-containing protein|nr:Hpt domain-containing protein [Bdellovibrionales bacterium]MBT3526612.1 Hpt domain-containing protein [Bdellovibrionales bacterium]MBT7669708.1 Hpt domain-containing protein [Bdellovibrionales bacterium]MBT7766730.1 Hpt domain-containing protein [Bdellovibrionales bacterium]